MEALTQEIALQLKDLSPAKQEQVLQYAISLRHGQSQGEKPDALLPYFGILDADSAEEIRKAIEDHCESIDLEQW